MKKLRDFLCKMLFESTDYIIFHLPFIMALFYGSFLALKIFVDSPIETALNFSGNNITTDIQFNYAVCFGAGIAYTICIMMAVFITMLLLGYFTNWFVAFGQKYVEHLKEKYSLEE